MSKLNSAGDTIVEVLIVVLVLASVLASAYAIAVSSLQSIQLTQERSYALKLAEGQLERLKSAATTNPAILSNANGFCLDGSLVSHNIGGGAPGPNMNSAEYGQYPAACTKDPNNGACDSYCYHIGIIGAGTDNYRASVRWDGPKGNLQQVQLWYRVTP